MSGSSPAQPAPYLTLGQVASPHGVRGGIKVNSFTDPPEALLGHVIWHLVPSSAAAAAGQARNLKLLGGSGYKGQLRVQLEGIGDRDAALDLSGWWVQVAREALPQPAEREYFRDDLIGSVVTNEEGLTLGVVSHFVDLPTGPVMVVKGEREHWVPAVPPHLRKVDLAQQQVRVDWPADL